MYKNGHYTNIEAKMSKIGQSSLSSCTTIRSRVPESRTTADREEGEGSAYFTAPEEPPMRPAILAAAVWAFEGGRRSCLWSF